MTDTPHTIAAVFVFALGSMAAGLAALALVHGVLLLLIIAKVQCVVGTDLDVLVAILVAAWALGAGVFGWYGRRIPLGLFKRHRRALDVLVVPQLAALVWLFMYSAGALVERFIASDPQPSPSTWISVAAVMEAITMGWVVSRANQSGQRPQ